MSSLYVSSDVYMLMSTRCQGAGDARNEGFRCCVVKQGGHLPLRHSWLTLSRRAPSVICRNHWLYSEGDKPPCCRYKAYLRWEHYRCATFFRCVMQGRACALQQCCRLHRHAMGSFASLKEAVEPPHNWVTC